MDRSIGTEAAKKHALTLVPIESWEENARFAYQNKLAEDYKKISDRREQVEDQASSAMLAAIRQACVCRLDDLLAKAKSDDDIADNWQINGLVHFSHLCRKEGKEKCVGRLVDWQEGLTDIEERNMQLSKLLIEHNGSTPSITTSKTQVISTLAEKRLLDVRGAGQPGKGRKAPTIGLSDIVWDRLCQLLANDKGDTALQPISEGEIVAVAMNELASPTGIGSARVPRKTQTTDDPAITIAKTLPKAKGYLKRGGSGDLIAPDDLTDESYWGLKNEAQLIDPRSIKEHSNWRVGNHIYWLIRSFFDYGGSSRNWLFLLHGEETGSAKLVDFTHRLRYRVGKNPSGLDEDGQIERTREFATTMGFGGWPLSFDRVSVAFKRYLIVSGLWTIDARRWITYGGSFDGPDRLF